MTFKHKHGLICFFLVLATILVYWQVRNHDFVNYDDNDYVYANPHIQQGITVDSIIWAVSNEYAANWHPVTWISHMFDYSLYAADPTGHLLTNLAIHILNTLLLYLILWRMTGAAWRSGFVAALFALHPLHVESVAWVSERKDLLSCFWGLLTILFYHSYATKTDVTKYAWVVLCFLLGLMSKPMLVTLPLLLLLFDFWPLKRAPDVPMSKLLGHSGFWRLVWEKLPLFLLSLGAATITLLAQKQGGTIQSLEDFSLPVRLLNAIVAYASYLGKMIWPFGLAAIYPHRGTNLAMWQIGVSFAILAITSGLIVVHWRKKKFLLTGWLWYLVSLVPVIGIVQVGLQAMADRYTYIPLIGIFVILAWLVPDHFFEVTANRQKAMVAVVFILIAMMLVSYRQVGFWQNPYTLFNRALAVTTDNYVAYNHLGLAKLEEGKAEEALDYFEQTLAIKPDYYAVWGNLGMAKLHLGRVDEAIKDISKAVEMAHEHFIAINNLGLAYYARGDFLQAKTYFQKALDLEPDNAKILDNLGGAYLKLGRLFEAERLFKDAIKVAPNYAEAHFDLALLYLQRGDLVNGVNKLKKTLEVDPNFTPARKMMESFGG